jgi:hypothetical protein
VLCRDRLKALFIQRIVAELQDRLPHPLASKLTLGGCNSTRQTTQSPR